MKFCAKCKEALAAERAAQYAKRAAAGTCGTCGEQRVRGRKKCARCMERDRLASRAYYHRKASQPEGEEQ